MNIEADDNDIVMLTIRVPRWKRRELAVAAVSSGKTIQEVIENTVDNFISRKEITK